MDKMKFESANLTEKNIEKLAELFPNCITETADENGKLKKAINFEMLRAMLSEDIADGDEAYEFTWVGKKAAIAEANRPIRKTLRPCVEESVNWDTTENLYIEGDNLEVLKLLQESYLKKVKMIYIDPPYNTGNDFIYRDDFAMSSDDYAEESGQIDEDGDRLFRNTDSNGRFHSDWCSMIYSRLLLARNLLTDDGVIFISIDDNEIENLSKICDEVFGENNFVAIINWKARGGRQDSKYYAALHEYILVYASKLSLFHAGEEIKNGDVYPKFDAEKNRYYKTQLLRKWGSNSRREDRPNLFYPIIAPDGSEVYPMLPKDEASSQNSENFGRWRHGASTMEKNIKDGKVEFVKQKDGTWIPYEKIYAPLEGEEKTKKYTTWIDDTNDGSSVVKSLFSTAVFDYPKSPTLLERFLKMACVEGNDIVLDFFSGSATTAHAVMQLNAEDGGHRKFIMVQLPEKTEENSEAFKAGYKNICEIGKERIRRAGAKIKEESPLTTQELDAGFRVLKLDETNMEDVYYSPAETEQTMLAGFETNIKPDRNGLDLLFGCLLEWGLPLSMPFRSEVIDGATVYTYNDGDLVACFDKNISEQVFKTIARRTPLRAVFRDDSFESSADKINVTEIFKLLSPETMIKVI